MGYTNVYNVKMLTERKACNIVFVNNYDTAIDLKAFFAKERPEYVSEINDNLLPHRKYGLIEIKNKNSLFKLLHKTDAVQKLLRKEGTDSAVKYIKEELEKMDLAMLIDRVPAAMSNLQRLRASYLHDAFDGKRDFLMCDFEKTRALDKEKRISSRRPYFTVAEYMRCRNQHENVKFNLVWITELSVNEMLELLGDRAREEDYGFFTMDDIRVVELNKEKLLRDYAIDKEWEKKEKQLETRGKTGSSVQKTGEPAKTTISRKNVTQVVDAGIAFDKARNCDRYFRTALPQYYGKDELKKAFELYKSAAEIGHPGAQFSLGELYRYGNEACTADDEKALYWYAMSISDNRYDGIVSDGVMEEVRYLAPMRITGLVLQVPNGRQLLRKYMGNKAEMLIQEAESEAKVKEAMDCLPKLDQEYLNKRIKEFMDRID